MNRLVWMIPGPCALAMALAGCAFDAADSEAVGEADLALGELGCATGATADATISNCAYSAGVACGATSINASYDHGSNCPGQYIVEINSNGHSSFDWKANGFGETISTSAACADSSVEVGVYAFGNFSGFGNQWQLIDTNIADGQWVTVFGASGCVFFDRSGFDGFATYTPTHNETKVRVAVKAYTGSAAKKATGAIIPQ